MLKNIWKRYFRRHNIIDQTVGPENDQATFLCNCGGYVVLTAMKRVPVYLDTIPVPVEHRTEGTIIESTCPKRPPTKIPEARVIA